MEKSQAPKSEEKSDASVSWWRSKWPITRFSLIFLLLMTLYYGLALTPWFDQVAFPAYLNMNARLSSSILNGMGERSEASGIIVRSVSTRSEPLYSDLEKFVKFS